MRALINAEPNYRPLSFFFFPVIDFPGIYTYFLFFLGGGLDDVSSLSSSTNSFELHVLLRVKVTNLCVAYFPVSVTIS